MQNNPTPAAKPKPSRPLPPPEFQSEQIDKLDSAGLTKILSDASASEFQKSKACQLLASRGEVAAVPAIAALLPDPKLSHYARYALEPMPGPAADDALRAALPRLKGNLLIGVINSIGFRRDQKAIMPLSRFVYGADVPTADAAAAALGHIGSADASKALQAALNKTKDPVRTYVARGALVCAENLLSGGSRDEALGLYQVLAGATMPKPVRLGAMHAIIGAETSTSRPRPVPPPAPGA
ncbi:MAG TPA: HEAT repeat domain-containing protein [Bryobacteraceae bacterium]|nr:HEAT repeat domain-containing protein [Bryobacteraceae bacterium]